MAQLNHPRIARALETLRNLRPELFGAEVHGFELNPELSEAVVTAFEKTHGIHLPPDYRSFLTSVGDGELDRFTVSFHLARWTTTFPCVIGGRVT